MRYFLPTALLLIVSAPALASDLGVSISIGQPGFYGQINFGSHYPRPQLIYPNPVLAMPSAVAIQQQPIYLYVPPGHTKKWNKHCHRYNACNQPVYFLDGNWYNNVYLPHYHSQNNYSEGHYNAAQHYDDNDHGHKHSKRRDEAHRQFDEDNQNKWNNRNHPGRSNNKHREKHDQEKNDKREKDRDNRRD